MTNRPARRPLPFHLTIYFSRTISCHLYFLFDHQEHWMHCNSIAEISSNADPFPSRPSSFYHFLSSLFSPPLPNPRFSSPVLSSYLLTFTSMPHLLSPLLLCLRTCVALHFASKYGMYAGELRKHTEQHHSDQSSAQKQLINPIYHIYLNCIGLIQSYLSV
jgi:hypothetical protein